MKSFTLTTAKTIGMVLLLIGIAPLLPAIGLMHLVALSCDESTDCQNPTTDPSKTLDSPIDSRVILVA